jgi:hypothetical protein
LVLASGRVSNALRINGPSSYRAVAARLDDGRLAGVCLLCPDKLRAGLLRLPKRHQGVHSVDAQIWPAKCFSNKPRCFRLASGMSGKLIVRPMNVVHGFSATGCAPANFQNYRSVMTISVTP